MAHEYAKREGAIPKAITSARESYSAPNLEVVFVRRAIRPSNPSKRTENKIAMDAGTKMFF